MESERRYSANWSCQGVWRAVGAPLSAKGRPVGGPEDLPRVRKEWDLSRQDLVTSIQKYSHHLVP